MLDVVTPEERPNPLHPHIREIVEQERLQEILLHIGVSAAKLDDVTLGLTNTICKHPERFNREPHTGWSRIVLKSFPPDIPATAIWFTFDEDHVYIEAVELIER